MEKFVINGCRPLSGEINISGAKNAVLPILAATVLNGGINVIHNCPDLKDVDVTVDILKHLGADVKREGSTIIVDSSAMTNCEIPENLVCKLRASIFFMGPLLARFGEVTISHPGDYVMLLLF